MSAIPQINIGPEKHEYFYGVAAKASDAAIRYRVVERFLCEVDRWLLRPATPVFNVDPIKECIRTLKSPAANIYSLEDAEILLNDEFEKWEKSIEDKDGTIETYNFRRFSDSAAEPLENEIYAALASFYRERPYSHANLSKFDLIITRLYTDIDRTGRRFLRFDPQEITQHIGQTFGDHDETPSGSSSADVQAVSAIHNFIAEAQGLDDFESLIACRLFDRYRQFKQELREQFFQPSVVAAAVQCNVVFANAFNEMLEAANENLSEILTSDLDIPGALHDAAPDVQSHLSDLLKEFFDSAPDESKARNGKASSHLMDLLSLAGEKDSRHADPLTESPNIEFDTTRSARERLWPLLETLTKPEPDAGLLLDRLSHAKSLQSLNLSDFLYAEDHSPDPRGRRILGLIMWTEEFRQNELGRSSTLTPTAQHEALSLIQKSEDVAAVLRADINAASEGSKGRLLVVQNSLLESRLRLESAIVKFTSRTLSPAPETSKPQERKVYHQPVPQPSLKKPLVKKRSFSWLAWLLILSVLAAAAYYVYPKYESVSPSDPSVTERIDTSKLADHDHLINAYGRGNTMFVTARDSWLNLPAEKQKESLKTLLEYQGATKYENVVLRDMTGHLQGNISPDGIYVPGESSSEGK